MIQVVPVDSIMNREMNMKAKIGFLDLIKRLGGEKMPLCNFCGTCIGLCSQKALYADYEKGRPVFIKERCNSCGVCYKNCQGIEVDFDALNAMFTGKETCDKFLGSYKECYLGHSTDDMIRQKGSSGGLVTQLLIHLVEKKLVSGVIIPRPNPEKKWLFKPAIVQDIEEIKKSSQSKYCLIPTNEILQGLKKVRGEYAIVLLPCQVHSIRKLQADGNRDALKLTYVLGLICGHNMEYEASVFGMKRVNISKEQVVDIKFRDHGSWPGGLSFLLENGEKRGINFFHYHYLNAVYLPYRCRICPDYYGNYADISFGDSWLMRLLGKGVDDTGIPLGWSSIIARTDTGLKLLKDALKKKKIFLEKVDPSEINESFPFNISYKLSGFFIRHAYALHKPEFRGLERPEKIERRLYHFVYNLVLILGSTTAFRIFINAMPLNFLLFLIKNFKRLMGYRPNARDVVVKYREKQ